MARGFVSCLRHRPEAAQAKGVKFGRKPKLAPHQRKEALKRRAAGETLASRLAE
ncbi:hypothetical protein [Bradyrhizobium sp. Arg816]|uniref:hypothetical protein n=1 Tax=Bradyrhizobium sp. Arg816 TaxID=2998491 RepID=UPI00249EC89E|nr:hypothetical protein [Bradyrhizobium sp. Arg816]MDI3567236.1 hypothetical protein [Bradyrhizobium sp. Arg816]